MSVTTTSLASPIGSKLIIDTLVNGVGVDGAISGSTTIYQIQIDNTLNTAPVYLKIADATSAVPGTTEPHQIYQCPGSVKVSLVVNSGFVLASGLSYWATTDAGSNGASNPGNPVKVRFLAS